MQLEKHQKHISLPTELVEVFNAFYGIPATMRMVEVKTGVLRPNICRYVARLQKAGKIRLVRFGYCPFTGHLAGFYSTHPEFTSNLSGQFQLF